MDRAYTDLTVGQLHDMLITEYYQGDTPIHPFFLPSDTRDIPVVIDEDRRTAYMIMERSDTTIFNIHLLPNFLETYCFCDTCDYDQMNYADDPWYEPSYADQLSIQRKDEILRAYTGPVYQVSQIFSLTEFDGHYISDGGKILQPKDGIIEQVGSYPDFFDSDALADKYRCLHPFVLYRRRTNATHQVIGQAERDLMEFATLTDRFFQDRNTQISVTYRNRTLTIQGAYRYKTVKHLVESLDVDVLEIRDIGWYSGEPTMSVDIDASILYQIASLSITHCKLVELIIDGKDAWLQQLELRAESHRQRIACNLLTAVLDMGGLDRWDGRVTAQEWIQILDLSDNIGDEDSVAGIPEIDAPKIIVTGLPYHKLPKIAHQFNTQHLFINLGFLGGSRVPELDLSDFDQFTTVEIDEQDESFHDRIVVKLHEKVEEFYAWGIRNMYEGMIQVDLLHPGKVKTNLEESV